MKRVTCLALLITLAAGAPAVSLEWGATVQLNIHAIPMPEPKPSRGKGRGVHGVRISQLTQQISDADSAVRQWKGMAKGSLPMVSGSL